MIEKPLSNISNTMEKLDTKIFNDDSIYSKVSSDIDRAQASQIMSINNINDNSDTMNDRVFYIDNRNKGKALTKVYFIKNKKEKVNLNKLRRKCTRGIPVRFSLANPFNRIKQFNTTNGIIKRKKTLKGRTISKDTTKNKNKVISISFIPNSPRKIKTFKVTNLYLKFAVVWILFMSVSIYSISTFINTWNENRFLKASIDAIHAKNAEQLALLNEKYSEVANLLEKGKEANIDIAALSSQYRDIIEKYVTGRISGSIASRSGNRTDNTFLSDVKELNSILNELSEINASKENLMIDLSEVKKNLRDYLDSLPTQWPVNSRISSPFGTRRDPITGRRAYHKGIDLAANYGTNIKAAGAGKVIFVGSYNELGLTVIIDHGNGIKSVYGHTSKTLVKKGQTVTKDTIIAKVGSSGRSTGAHLHFEIRVNDTPVDPLNYLESK